MMVLVWCQFVMFFVTTNPHHSLLFMLKNMDLNLFVQKLSKMELLISCFLKMLSFLKLICASVEQSPGVVYLTKPFGAA